jgi:hypothetical protein
MTDGRIGISKRGLFTTNGAKCFGKLIVTGDLTNIPALFVTNLGWHAAFDQDPQLAEKNRRTLFERAMEEDAVLTGYHWGMPGAGTIKKDGNGYALVPVNES